MTDLYVRRKDLKGFGFARLRQMQPHQNPYTREDEHSTHIRLPLQGVGRTEGYQGRSTPTRGAYKRRTNQRIADGQQFRDEGPQMDAPVAEGEIEWIQFSSTYPFFAIATPQHTSDCDSHRKAPPTRDGSTDDGKSRRASTGSTCRCSWLQAGH